MFLAGYPVLETTREELAEYLKIRIDENIKTALFFANTNFIVNCRELLDQLKQDDVLIVNDGIGMDIACRLLHGRKFKSNLNGTDFSPFFIEKSKKTYRIFLLGGKHDVLNKAAYFLVHELGQTVVGSCDGYVGIKNPGLVEQINELRPDILLVAMGNPIQEKWILENYHRLDVRLFSGVGALFDFWAGDKPRAPQFVQNIRMEWFYRLCIEPKRLLKRYTFDIAIFLSHCMKYKNQR